VRDLVIKNPHHRPKANSITNIWSNTFRYPKPSLALEQFFFFTLFVQNACRITDLLLINKTSIQQIDIALSFLDGYVSWLPADSRQAFVDSLAPKVSLSYFASNTFQNVTRFDSQGDSARPYPYEVYLRLWRLLFQVCEHISHCPHRLAQLFHWEITHHGPLLRACCVTDITNFEIPFNFTEDMLNFYQDGTAQLQHGAINFDDFNEQVTSPIPDLAKVKIDSSVKDKGAAEKADADSLPRPPPILTKLGKTFYEPEGMLLSINSLSLPRTNNV